MKLGRFLFLLAIIFLAAFWWAGGNTTFKQNLPPLPDPGAALRSDDSGVAGKVYRIIFLKSAVAAKVDTTKFTKLQTIPVPMQQAIIAMEDNRFYNHFGIDLEGIVRAALVNMQNGSIIEGGSTITQQLAKNLFLSREQTVNRKLEEAILSLDMEMQFSKEEILEMYLNTIYFGAGAYGIQEAAQIYFGKKPAELNLAESALLAGLPNGPSIYSPYTDVNAARQRQALVLNAMVRHGYIGPGLAQEAKTTPLILKKNIK
jgi:membrane peptidoglycan carboxypeptidase